MKLIDLTQTLKSGVQGWSKHENFQLNTSCNHQEHNCCVQSLEMPAGIGTHMDAPYHFIENGKDIASMAIEKLMVPAIILDVREKAHADYFISASDIENFEKQYGKIPEKVLVLALTGWSQYWNQPDKYRNMDKNNQRHFPGFSEEAINFLIGKNIVGVGIDTLSPDGSHKNFPIHQKLLSAGKYIIENLCNLEKLPLIETTVIALPLKIANASESPCRVIAITT